MVAALELDDRVAAGGGTRHSNGGCSGLGAAVDHAHYLNRRRQRNDQLGEIDFGRAGSRYPEGSPARRGVLDRIDHVGLRVAQDDRPPRADEVDELGAILRDEHGAGGSGYERRMAPNRLERAYR